MEVYSDVLVTVESEDCEMTGVIVAAGVTVVVETKLEDVSYVEGILDVEIETSIEETVADPDNDRTVDTTEGRVTTDEDRDRIGISVELATWAADIVEESVWVSGPGSPGIETDSLGDNTVEGGVVTGRLVKVGKTPVCGVVSRGIGEGIVVCLYSIARARRANDTRR